MVNSLFADMRCPPAGDSEPRAAQALMLTVRARALLHGRLAPSAEDVIDMARPVLSHRMALNFAARAREHFRRALRWAPDQPSDR